MGRVTSSSFGPLRSHLRVDGVGDLLPPRDLIRGEDAGSQGVALAVRRDLRGLRDDEAFRRTEIATRREGAPWALGRVCPKCCSIYYLLPRERRGQSTEYL